MWNQAGGSFNFQSYSTEPKPCGESMRRVNSTLNLLHKLILQQRIHIDNGKAFRQSSMFLCFLFFYPRYLRNKVLAFFTASHHPRCCFSVVWTSATNINSDFNKAPFMLCHRIISGSMLNTRKWGAKQAYFPLSFSASTGIKQDRKQPISHSVSGGLRHWDRL